MQTSLLRMQEKIFPMIFSCIFMNFTKVACVGVYYELCKIIEFLD